MVCTVITSKDLLSWHSSRGCSASFCQIQPLVYSICTKKMSSSNPFKKLLFEPLLYVVEGEWEAREMGEVHTLTSLHPRSQLYPFRYVMTTSMLASASIFSMQPHLWSPTMKETPWRRITVTSSSNEYSRISWEIGWW